VASADNDYVEMFCKVQSFEVSKWRKAESKSRPSLWKWYLGFLRDLTAVPCELCGL